MHRQKGYLLCNPTMCPLKQMHITFQHLGLDDLPVLHSWFIQPHVAYWWPESSHFADFYTKWSGYIASGLSAYRTEWYGHIIVVDEKKIGYIHCYSMRKNQYPDYPIHTEHTVGIDFFIGEYSSIGKKLSSPILHTYKEKVIRLQKQRVNRIVIDPSITNTRAIHVYTKAGFKPLTRYIQGGRTVLLMHMPL